MRTLSNLYSIALEHYRNSKYHQNAGLCALISNLYCNNIFNDYEYQILRKSIYKNRPTKSLHKEHCYWPGENRSFWWPPSDPTHRITFLEKMITYVELPWYVRLWDRLK